jgi:dihydropteroate synthase
MRISSLSILNMATISTTACMHPTLQTIIKKPFAIMGIVNSTPDSFYDGGRYHSLQSAVEHALALVAEGADIIDVGGQSTRPGARQISALEESERIVPVIRELSRKTGVCISVDTFNSSVAEKALDAGAHWVNDVSSGRFDGNMPFLIAQRQCPVVLMHGRNTPETMQQNPYYDDVVAEVKHELGERVEAFTKAGVMSENIIIDPGIGFAKRLQDNLALLAHCKDLLAMGYPICLGTSRKSFIGGITGEAADERLQGSLASIGPAFEAGVTIFRVHDVKATKSFLEVLCAIREASSIRPAHA